MTTISLKITIIDQNTTKTMQFLGNMTINEVCNEIRNKLGDSLSVSTDHGIFFPFQTKWLLSNKTLDYYDLKTGDVVEYKKKHRALRVRLMDDTIKTVLIDESNGVSNLVISICQKIGISNPEEYSLQAEDSGRGRDEGGRWLDPDKTLAEQGIIETDILLLKKKFFFSDQNVDRNDPIQLNLVYVQARDDIVSGKHPCTLDEAAQLAALQCQVQFGNHEPDKHKPGFIKIKEFVPPEYHKDKKEIEKKIFQEHRKLQGLTELNAKFRYVQLSRSLKTYGVTFYMVKEKVAKKNKMVPRLLGVTRDSIMRLDAETKEILKVWPLTTLRRWAAAPNSFTLDFGDYADAYYSVQTSEGEAISKLIGGYIDIILKKRKEATRQIEEEEAQIAIAEENVKPVKATAVNVLKNNVGRAMEMNVVSAGVVSEDAAKVGSKQMVKKRHFTQAGDVGGDFLAHGSQQALLQNISNGFASIKAATNELSVSMQLPPLGNDPASRQWKVQTMDVNKQVIATQIGSHLASTAAVVSLATAQDYEMLDFESVAQQISSLSMNMAQIASSTKMLAALMEGTQGDRVLDAAKTFAGSTSKLLQSIQSLLNGEEFEGKNPYREELFANGQEISKAAFQLLFKIGESEIPQQQQQEMIDLAKAITQATVGLVSKGIKPVAVDIQSNPHLREIQQFLLETAKEAALNAEVLVNKAMITAPAIHLAACKDQVLDGTIMLNDNMTSLNDQIEPMVEVIGNSNSLQEFSKQIQNVIDAIRRLVEKVKDPLTNGDDNRNSGPGQNLDFLEAILDSSSKLIADINDSQNLVANAKTLTLAGTRLVNHLKTLAENESDADQKKKLIDQVKEIAENIHKMVSMSKELAKTPSDEDKKSKLLDSVNAIQILALQSTGKEFKDKIFKKLIGQCKQTAASTTSLIASSKAAALSNRDQLGQIQVTQASKKAADVIVQMAIATKALVTNMDDSAAQLKLLNAVRVAINPANDFVFSAKTAASTTADVNAQEQLLNGAKQVEEDIKVLQVLLGQAENASYGLEYESAMEIIKVAQMELGKTQQDIASNNLKGLAGYTEDSAQAEVTATVKVVGAAIAQLVTASSQGNEKQTGTAASETANAFLQWSHAVRALAGCTQRDPVLQKQLIDSAEKLSEHITGLINNAKNVVSLQKSRGADKDSISEAQSILLLSAKETNDYVIGVIDILPGHRDVEKALQVVTTGIKIIEQEPAIKTNSGETLHQLQSKLNAAASALAVATNSLINASRSGKPDELKAGAEQFEEKYNKMISAAQAVIAQSSGKTSKDEVMEYVKTLSLASIGLLESFKGTRIDPNGAGLSLNDAAKGMANAISKLLEVSTTSSPGVQEAAQAEQQLLSASQKLAAVNDSVIANLREAYPDCIRSTTESMKQFSSISESLKIAAKELNTEKTGKCMLDMAKAISRIAECTARAAYLIGAGDPSSIPGQPAVLDLQALELSAKEIKQSILKLQDISNDQQAILSAAALIAKNTANLCNATKNASNNNNVNAIAKQQFTQYSKGIASFTANLVQDIKSLASNPSNESRAKVSSSSAPLVESIDLLITYCANPEFNATPASISPLAQIKQKPLLESAQNMLSLAQDVVATGKSFCSSDIPDGSSANLLFNQAKGVMDSLRVLSNCIKQSAPGQQEIQSSIEKISGSIAQIEGASIQLEVGELNVSGSNQNLAKSNPNMANAGLSLSDQSFKDKLLDNARALSSLVSMIADSAKGKVDAIDSGISPIEKLNLAVQQLADTYQPMATTALALASSTSSKAFQKTVLDGVKRIGDDAVNILYAAKDSGGDTNAGASHSAIDNAKQQLMASLNKMSLKLEGSTQGTNEITKVSSNIQDTLRSLADAKPAGNMNEPYQKSAQEIFAVGKTLVDQVGDLITKSSKPSKEVILPLVEKIGTSYTLIVQLSLKASSSASDPKIKQGLQDVARELGGSTLRLLDAIKSALISSASSGDGTVDLQSKQKLTSSSREVSQQITKLMAVAKEGSKSLVACEDVIEKVNDIISDLDSHIMFAQAGQLDSLDARDRFDLYKEELQYTAREIVEISKILVSAAAATNAEELANAAVNIGEVMGALKDSTKKGAAAVSSSDSDTQEDLLSQCKEVSKALIKLLKTAVDIGTKPLKPVTGTLSAAGVSKDFLALRDDAKQLVTHVGDFIKVVKLVGDESSRGARALESTTREIEKAISVLMDSNVPAEGSALPDEVAQIAKHLAAATANLVSVSSRGITVNNQDDLIVATTELKKFLLDLTRAGNASTEQAPEDVKALMLHAVKAVADSTCHLLDKVKSLAEGNAHVKPEIQASAKDVASAVGQVVDAVGQLIPEGYIDPNDPNVVAERELLGAASSIEAAARKLAMLKPPERPKEANEELNFEEQILEAAKAIAAATSALIKSATSAQREIIAKGKSSEKKEDQMYFSDGTWSDGLVSAAKNVAAATGDLCEAANAAVKGEVQRERVIVSARNVSGSTMQLLHAAASRANSDSQAQIRLKAAGKSVTQATEALVKAAEESMAFDAEENNVGAITSEKNSSKAMQKAKELEAAAKVLQMEKELEMARQRLAGMRKAKYQK